MYYRALENDKVRALKIYNRDFDSRHPLHPVQLPRWLSTSTPVIKSKFKDRSGELYSPRPVDFSLSS